MKYFVLSLFYFGKSYKHGLREIGMFNIGFVPLKSLFYSATSLHGVKSGIGLCCFFQSARFIG